MKLYPLPNNDNKVLYATSFNSPMMLTDWDHIAQFILQSPAKLVQTTHEVRNYAATGDEVGYAKGKKRLPVVLPAALFEGRRVQACFKALTGCSMLDFDHVEGDLEGVKRLVCQDPHTLLCHTTPSGRGLRVFFRYALASETITMTQTITHTQTQTQTQPQTQTDEAPDGTSPTLDYTEAWRTGNDYYRMLTGLPYDIATKDITRLSFLCHDAAGYYNPQAVPIMVEPCEAAASLATPPAAAPADPHALAERLVERSGLHYLPGSRHNYLVSLLFYLLKMGVCQADAEAWVRSRYPDNEDDPQHLVASIYRHSDEAHTWRGIANTTKTKTQTKTQTQTQTKTKADEGDNGKNSVADEPDCSILFVTFPFTSVSYERPVRLLSVV